MCSERGNMQFIDIHKVFIISDFILILFYFIFILLWLHQIMWNITSISSANVDHVRLTLPTKDCRKSKITTTSFILFKIKTALLQYKYYFFYNPIREEFTFLALLWSNMSYIICVYLHHFFLVFNCVLWTWMLADIYY